MRRKISILTAMFLAATVAAFVVAPSTAEQRAQVAGTPYVLPTGFVVPLDSGQTAMLSVAVVFTADSGRAWLTGAEQLRVHRLVTAAVKGAAGRRLVSAAGRRALETGLRDRLRATGLPVEAVLIPDLAVK
jgi:Na+/H+-dicarboxylate symporter